jgi:hypothetical protein
LFGNIIFGGAYFIGGLANKQTVFYLAALNKQRRWSVAGRWSLFLGILAYSLFLGLVSLRGSVKHLEFNTLSQVVIPAPAQVVLYGGDRFLAADVEAIRAATSNPGIQEREGGYRLRAHQVVSRLNPCHEDNYWLGNAALSFGGAADAGTEILGRASQCRFWDEMPPFLYGFNQRFFNLDIQRARKSMELAADRATVNAPGFRQAAIMMTISAIKDANAAIAMLHYELERARDAGLRVILNKRIERLRGLVILREAKKDFEDRFKKQLESPVQLIEFGILKSFPKDPLQLGYVFRDGEFHLQKMQVDGFN